MTAPTSTPSAVMRALVLANYGEMRVELRPTPYLPADHVLLRVVATGICGSDLHGYTGENGRRSPGQVMGHETAAQVVASGADVADPVAPGTGVTINPTLACGTCADCAAGDDNHCVRRRVIGVDPAISSGFGQFLVVPARNVVTLDPALPLELGALIEPLAVGAHAVARAGDVVGATVGVIGAGPIGQAVILAARRAGASRVVVVETVPSRRALATRLGAEAISPDDSALAAAAGAPLAVVIDAVGSPVTVAAALDAARRGGRVVLVGMHSPRLDLAAYAVSTEERSLIGAFCYADAEFRATAAWAAANVDDLRPLVSDVVGLDEAPAAFQRLAAGGADESKILVRVDLDRI